MAISIEAIHPSSGATGVLIGDTIWVLFNEEMDETSITNGGLVVAGPEYEIYTGPDRIIFDDNTTTDDDGNLLSSAGYKGFVAGTITFQRIENSGDGIYSGYDYGGSGVSGTAFRHKAIFTPTVQLSPNTTFTVYVFGDEDQTDTLKTGVKTRTVFDPTKGANLGTSNVTFIGGYEGTAEDYYNIQITSAGGTGTALYKWWKDSEPTIFYTSQRSSIRNTLLDTGVYVSFERDGLYELGDTFRVYVKPSTTMDGNYTWTFQTSSGSIQTLPTETSTTILGDFVDSAPSQPDEFTVVSTTPENRQSSVTVSGFDTIVVEFSHPINSGEFLDSYVTITGEPVNGNYSDSSISYTKNIGKVISISGSTMVITLV